MSMRILLVNPTFPTTYWGFQYALPFAGKGTGNPPLGLISVAALLPSDWQYRLVDLNFETLRNRQIHWADVVLTGGMRVQVDSMHEIIRRVRSCGRRVVVGGPAATATPGEFADADLVFAGEAEGRTDSLVAAMQTWSTRLLTPGRGDKPSLEQATVPRYDLLDLDRYATASLQFSRGCPYNCEFCDVIEIFGRKPRVKSCDQVLRELDALYDTGYRGALFFVDDNFIGNKRAVKELLPRLTRWQRERNMPFDLFTEASINLAADEGFVREMNDAGFTAVFLGIETPVPETLASAGKSQNVKVDLDAAVDRLTRLGLEVMGGFIVGFDQDNERTFDAQHDFIAGSPIPLAMVGLMMALPGTQMWQRLDEEGRLRSNGNGDQFSRPNFVPTMDEEELLTGYRDLMARLYSTAEYYDRCEEYLQRAKGTMRTRPVRAGDLRSVWRAATRIGLGRRSLRFWRLIARSVLSKPGSFGWSLAHAIQGEHMIRYTREHLLPMLDVAIAQVRREKRRAASAAWAGAHLAS